MTEAITQPILNNPYELPSRHHELGPQGPTGKVLDGRRVSESFVPIAKARKGATPAPAMSAPGSEQQSLDLDITGERREANDLINSLRREVGLWRMRGYPTVTPYSRKLLEHWSNPDKENRVLFAQREAAETAIYLAEVAGRAGNTDWRSRFETVNAEHNYDLPRIALKLATGAGKTVVMGMLIAWHTINKVHSPRDGRFSKRFLIVAPGVTIRDRLQVLQPSAPDNYYDERDLVPPELQHALSQAEVKIINYHQLQPKLTKEFKDLHKNTRKFLAAGAGFGDEHFKESPEQMVSRVLRGFTGKGKLSEIVVFNDEAHHCYVDRASDEDAAKVKKLSALEKSEVKEATEAARAWFRGLQAIAHKVGIKTVYDLSATPFYLTGSGWPEGFIFPWVASDFSLMDAIESGLVKVPRTPVNDDAAGDTVAYLNLWDNLVPALPSRNTDKGINPDTWMPPPVLQGALESLYADYEKAFAYWQEHWQEIGEPPPVFIVVCSNTLVSKLVYQWIAGTVTVADPDSGDRDHYRPGNLALFANGEGNRPYARPTSLLIDTKAIESGEGFTSDFLAAAAAEIEAFKADYRIRYPGADADAITNEELLREVLNTVGKRGKLGADVRCVVSVSMLTEGWDANNVTHILGVRAFRSQLLCEQVVGRGLRRRSYVLNDQGMFDAEYANVYGIPFAFIPSDGKVVDTPPSTPAVEVYTKPERELRKITFPHVQGYRIEQPDLPPTIDTAVAPKYLLSASNVPTWTETSGLVGESVVIAGRDTRSIRAQSVAYKLAETLIDRKLTADDDSRRPWLFADVLALCRTWLQDCVVVEEGRFVGEILQTTERLVEAAEYIYQALTEQDEDKRITWLRPVLREFRPIGSTDNVYFQTRKPVIETDRSPISHVVLDPARSGGTNQWEKTVAEALEDMTELVVSYVKNDHLGFTIPYTHKGKPAEYHPDFLVRLAPLEGDSRTRTLIVEVSGGQKPAGSTRAKADTARNTWVPAVNNHGGLGRWGYLEIRSMSGVKHVLTKAIRLLNSDVPIPADLSTPDQLTI
ncbi:Type III restriction-modification enzyme, helicase subunit [Rhodococcus wratislaviensis]|uniref:Type III restriction-modification enzyme, helicase subunit n=1 Tax=Rhodococcus wratislaviensis TaxID=44752 RepID=A0A402CBL1_RHOWR|nr:DEAD/DEAH box helicase family protein [Rhodococcus wratislaviensis]GCE40986.1 Type III restriction-modification enzyme, helicase subunit [Rhodococcus wratislaviensis]